MIKVYIKVDSNNNVVDINSSIFLKDREGYICVDEGVGDRYAHAQNNYLPLPLLDDYGHYTYKYIDHKIVQLTE